MIESPRSELRSDIEGHPLLRIGVYKGGFHLELFSMQRCFRNVFHHP